jgi:aryl-alcohol dehydrogenase-like predicted oxidoreductase
MKHVRIGGSEVSRLALGCMSYGAPGRGDHPWTPSTRRQSDPFFRRALELGINFFDTANTYIRGHQRGDPRPRDPEARAPRPGLHRDQGLLPGRSRPAPDGKPKEPGGLSRAAILRAIDASLRRLQMEHVDLYQIHRWDYETPLEETLAALDEVVKSGKARSDRRVVDARLAVQGGAAAPRRRTAGRASSRCRTTTTC